MRASEDLNQHWRRRGECLLEEMKRNQENRRADDHGSFNTKHGKQAQVIGSCFWDEIVPVKGRDLLLKVRPVSRYLTSTPINNLHQLWWDWTRSWDPPWLNSSRPFWLIQPVATQTVKSTHSRHQTRCKLIQQWTLIQDCNWPRGSGGPILQSTTRGQQRVHIGEWPEIVSALSVPVVWGNISAPAWYNIFKWWLFFKNQSPVFQGSCLQITDARPGLWSERRRTRLQDRRCFPGCCGSWKQQHQPGHSFTPDTVPTTGVKPGRFLHCLMLTSFKEASCRNSREKKQILISSTDIISAHAWFS